MYRDSWYWDATIWPRRGVKSAFASGKLRETFLKFFRPACRYQYCKAVFGPQNGFGGIQDIVPVDLQAKIRRFSPVAVSNVVGQMPKSSNDCSDAKNQEAEPAGNNLTVHEDLLMEQILDNINTTPIGQVLKRIASLPEVRREKVLRVRRQLNQGRYDLNERLDIVLDKVLEDLTA